MVKSDTASPDTDTQDSLLAQLPHSASELQAVDQFRRAKSTAVLTILFTDIKGFTRMTEERGEAYSNKLRRQHDELIVPIIEKDGAGRVIKHIGDSVMAVFSEPSAAVARALEAQEKLAGFNRAHPELEDIEVRMGLHCGQVTTENDVSADVFGRHVNRAARVEALADGGQVLVTYTVFDSARGWLNESSETPVAWEKHGRYALKGIPEPVEIFEPYNPKLGKPKAPAGGVKPGASSARIIYAIMAGALVMAVVMAFVTHFFLNSRPQVSLVDYNTDWATLSDGHQRLAEKFLVGGEPGQHIRPVLTELGTGHYLLSAETSQIVRFFAPFDVKPGKNLLEMKFARVELPGMERRVEFSKTGPNTLQESQDYTYTSYGLDMAPHQNTAHIDMALKAEKDPEDAQKVKLTCTWTVLQNGKAISQGSVSDRNMIKDQDVHHSERKILWSDDFHFYYLSYYMSGTAGDFTIEANFADYKNR
jgi:class 3 adenylate cyclase